MRIVDLPFEVSRNELPFPLRMYKPGSEWIVELCWPEDSEGHVAVCGVFSSTDYSSAKAFYDNAYRIISCWHVDLIWRAEGKLRFSHESLRQTHKFEGDPGGNCKECGLIAYEHIESNLTDIRAEKH